MLHKGAQAIHVFGTEGPRLTDDLRPPLGPGDQPVASNHGGKQGLIELNQMVERESAPVMMAGSTARGGRA